jgi:cubilin
MFAVIVLLLLLKYLDIDECARDRSICHALATCINMGGSFTCQCPERYHGDGVSTCLSNNPCDIVPCFPGLKCSRTSNGSYGCEKCPPFFYGDGINCIRNKSKSE